MLPVNFFGPYALLPNTDGTPLLLGTKESWQPGLYLWTFLYNKADRINYIGCCPNNIAERHNKHFNEFLGGARSFYQIDDLRSGALTRAYSPDDGINKFIENFDTLLDEMSLIRVFFAPLDEPPEMLTRIATAIAAHLQRLGGRAAGWLDVEPVSYDSRHYPEPVTIRLGRPAFIASLPDEMHL